MSDPLHQSQSSLDYLNANENLPPKYLSGAGSFRESALSQHHPNVNPSDFSHNLPIQIRQEMPLKGLHESLGAVSLSDKPLSETQHLADTINLRKGSLVDCEISCEEVQEDEQDITRKINQKLIKKYQVRLNSYSKNYFMAFVSKANYPQTSQKINQDPSASVSIIDKRSRSETPNKMSATEVLFRAHQKLQMRRKESPQKLLEKHQQRQKKAEELRAQIESSKKKWYEKIRHRQEIAKARWQELLAERKAKLLGKLEQAEERRETEIERKAEKAKMESEKVDETNYIVKMTMNNMKLDLDNKLNDTRERRNKIMEEHMKRHFDRHLKEEAAVKRKAELIKDAENKLLMKQMRRKQADQRRTSMLQAKKKAAQEYQKRIMVLQRKNDLGDRISDVMSFVSNSENIWEFLGNESEWQDAFGSSQNLFDLISKDQFELEKLKLKRDAELLSKVMVIDENGEIIIQREHLDKLKKRRGADGSTSEEDEESEEIFSSPEVFKRGTPNRTRRREEAKDESDCSDKDSVADETDKGNEIFQQETEEEFKDQGPPLQENQFTDEEQNFMLYNIRLKMSMKRNILKKTLSEDLTWADFLKNDCYNGQNQMYPNQKNGFTRSMYSTPERKSDSNNTNKESQVNDDNSRNSQGMNPNSNQHNSSSSNLSEKSRLSSVVYPSKKKKNPKNQNVNGNTSSNVDIRNSGSFVSSKQKYLSGSNNSSTQSLHLQNTIGETPREQNKQRNSVQLESDSARKKNARMHSSSVQEQTVPNLVQLINNNQTMDTDDIFFDTQLNTTFTHTGTQMNQLLTNSKPLMPMSKVIPKKLTVNASKMLFPIIQQKLLLKRPGKEGQFGKCKIHIRIDDLIKTIQTSSVIMPFQNQVSFNNDSSIQTDITKAQTQPLQQPSSLTKVAEEITQQTQTDSSNRKSLNSTPSFTKRRDSTETNNSSNNQLQQLPSQLSTQLQSEVVGTPTQQSKLWELHKKFWEKFKNPNDTGNQDSYIKPKYPSGINNSSSNLPSESSPSPKKDSKKAGEDNVNTSQNNNSVLDTSQSMIMNDQGYKELIIKYLLTDNVHQLKTEDTQKTIFLDQEDSNKLIDYLEQHELSFRYCRLCDLQIPDHLTNEAHIQAKAHKKTREELYIKENEDLQFSILEIKCQPGDIEKELLKEKEKALKRKVKRIKQQMIAQAVNHETAAYCPGKDINSANKKRFYILCIDLEKQVMPIIKDYEMLEVTLKEIIKILEMRKTADLHLLRKLKFIPILIEICKRISVCHKNELKHLGRILDFTIKIINIFCGLRENRNYMLQTNRMSALIELMNWCLNRSTQLFYGISFMPQLFHILTLHIKHRAPYECQAMKDLFIEYLMSSTITQKIKSKFQIINGPLDLTEMMGQVPLFLLKSANFLEALTSLVSIDAKYRPVYEKTQKIGEHVFFVIQNTEMFGIPQMIATILLTMNHQFKPSTQSGQIQQKILPQTILSLAITSIKIVNDIYRIDYRFAQQIMSDFETQEQLYHLFNFILVYGVETADKQEDSKELLHETLLLIGYFCLNNEKNQALLCKGESPILQKLCNLPFTYFCDKKLKEILFSTLIQASYKNDRSLAIMDQEMSVEMLVDFLHLNIKEELPKIIEEENDYQSLSSHQAGNGGLDRKSHRSPSISSTNSSQCSLQIDIINGNSPYLSLYMRFPKKLWKDAISFYSKVLY